MNKNKISVSFQLNDPLGNEALQPKTWTENSQEYLLFFPYRSPEPLFTFSSFTDSPGTLIIPQDNPTLISQIQNRQPNDLFTTPLSNLKFRRDFISLSPGSQVQTPWKISGILVKDLTKLKKATGVPPFPEITFKVIGERKVGHARDAAWNLLSYKESFRQFGSYEHELEIEPLDLGIEGMPPITKIIFAFADPTNPTLYKPLTKMKLYNSNILTQSVGKQFTMRVKAWNFTDGNLNCLKFNSDWDFEWDSFRETSVDNNSDEPIPTNNPPPSNPPQKDNDNSPAPSRNKGLIIGVVVLIILLIIGFLSVRKVKKLSKTLSKKK
ncbi:MAG: hypothetical protein MRERV_30c024 [Mycoplasmataceae bacterium RV_VA103A]|nr:MAG: hypothetical protein MRERV_30c024 [Mycoplasmataceae bacterium RV_VA103A]